VRTRDLDNLLRRLLESGDRISDINFTPGKPPQVEQDGDLRFPFIEPPLPELTPFMSEQIALNLLHDRRDLVRDLLQKGSCDCAYEVPGLARFRANIFTQRGSLSIVLRKLETQIPTIHDLVLPRVFQQMATLNKGLILLTGAAGQGKTSTMAALIHEVNLTRPVHVITLEDPIEFVHKHQIGTVNQRELGVDFDSWAGGLRAALRQSPRVIVLGELRDRETMETALHAADSGHLVVATMHTLGAGQTIHRLVGMFSGSEQARVRARLAGALQFVVAQWLVPRRSGGRIAALEILGSTVRTRELVREGEKEKKTFYKAMTDGATDGMQTCDQHLVHLFADGLVSETTVSDFCTDRVAVTREMDRILHERSLEVGSAPRSAPQEPGLSDLKVDFTYGRREREGGGHDG
jgi:twitching motility protein PilT